MNISIMKWLSQVLSDPFCLSYLSIQVIIFIYFCMHVLLPILNRKRQFAKILKATIKQKPEKKPITEVRLFLQENIKKTIPWAYDQFQNYKEAWTESRIGDDDKAASQ